MNANHLSATYSGPFRVKTELNMKQNIAKTITQPSNQQLNLKVNHAKSIKKPNIFAKDDNKSLTDIATIQNNPLNYVLEVKVPSDLRKSSLIQSRTNNNIKSRVNNTNNLNENVNKKNQSNKQPCINQLPQSPIAFKKNKPQNGLNVLEKTKSLSKTIDPKYAQLFEFSKKIPELTIINKPPPRSILSPKTLKKEHCYTDVGNETNDDNNSNNNNIITNDSSKNSNNTPLIKFATADNNNRSHNDEDFRINCRNNENILMSHNNSNIDMRTRNGLYQKLTYDSLNDDSHNNGHSYNPSSAYYNRSMEYSDLMLNYPSTLTNSLHINRIMNDKSDSENKSLHNQFQQNLNSNFFSLPINRENKDEIRAKTDSTNLSSADKSIQSLIFHNFDNSIKSFSINNTNKQSPKNKIFTPDVNLKPSNNIFSKLTSEQTINSRSSSNGNRFKNLNSLSKITTERAVSYSKHIFDNIFNRETQRRTKCSCDFGLKEKDTCSRALSWLKLRYTENDLEYLKDTYKTLLETDLRNLDCVIQIQKDITRTFPGNKFFSSENEGLKSLERVLNAFAKYEPQIGYVQGMNFIAASLIYHSEEYIAFWLLAMIFEKFEMRDIYLPNLPGLSKHCQIIDILMGNYIPDLYAHLCTYEIKVQMFCAEWIFALFSSVIPVERIGMFYDNMLTQGWPYFYKLILAYLMQFKKQILAENDFPTILTILKSQNQTATLNLKDKKKLQMDWNELFEKALKLEIDSYFIYKMHSNYDNDTQLFKVELQSIFLKDQ